MGNTVRCCIACVLPCGALDMVRVLHGDGRVEEFGRGAMAGEVMKAHPKHVLAEPIYQERSAVTVLHPDAELERGKIYLLLPAYNLHKQCKEKPKKHLDIVAPELPKSEIVRRNERNGNQVLSCRKSGKKGGKRGKRAWKPMLDCIAEIDECLSI